jgi:hypothetical protein
MSFQSIFRATNQWFFGTPERALDQAYRATLMIKAIEDEHFNGKKISANSGEYSDSVISYFEADLKKYLNTTKIRLAEFKSSRSVFSASEANKLENRRKNFNPSSLNIDLDNEQQSIIIEKLNFIDKTIKKYSEPARLDKSLVPLSQFQGKQIVQSGSNQSLSTEINEEVRSLQQGAVTKNTAVPDIETVADKTGVLPRSILRTFNRLQQELDPKAEEEVVKNFRNSKRKTIFSLKFILTLIIVPILTHQIAKTFIFGPIIDGFRNEHQNPSGIFLNLQMEEEAFSELKLFEEELKFKSLIGLTPKITSEEIEEQVKEKATLLAEEFREKGSNAIKNIFADLLSMASFALVIVSSKQEIFILKSFMDDLVYGLSDSAKAFIIILLTDIFVGFHSPHGWEVILKGVSQHLGIPENQDFIFLFIATFPVILDSVFKYWIFRYLNRVSPSAVATYRNMNE